MGETLGGVRGNVAPVPREALGLEPPTREGVAGDVTLLVPRENQFPSVDTGDHLGGEAVLGEGVEQGDDGGEVSVHVVVLSGL